MATSLRLFHGQHFSLDTPLTDDELAAAGPEALAADPDVFGVETATGTSWRRRTKIKAKGGYTDVDMPDGYPGSPIEWAHFEQAITERHAATAWIADVAMRPGGDIATARRAAAVFDANMIEWKDQT